MSVNSQQQHGKEIAIFWKQHTRPGAGWMRLGKEIALQFCSAQDSLDYLFTEWIISQRKTLFKAATVRRFTRPCIPVWLGWNRAWRPWVPRCVEYRLAGIHQFGAFRKAFRSPENPERYNFPVFHLLRALAYVARFDFMPDELLKLYFEQPELFQAKAELLSPLIAPLLAAKLDSGDAATLELCRKAIYDNGFTGREMIEGLLYSKQESNWKMAADLLLAARLQEGVRQHILEAASDCRLEAFIYLMKTVQEHDLLRFAATVRAFAVWTGLPCETERPASVRRSFALALDLLEHPEKHSAAFDRGDPLELYLALWAEGCRDTDAALRDMRRVLKNLSGPRRCAGLFFLEMTGEPVTAEFVADRLESFRDDPAALAALLEFLPDAGWSALVSLKRIPASPARREKLFMRLLPFLLELPAKERKIAHPFLAGRELILSRSSLWNLLIQLAAADIRTDLIVQLLPLVSDMSAADQKRLIEAGFRFLDWPCRYLHPCPAELRKWLFDTASGGRQTVVRAAALERIEQLRPRPGREELLQLAGLLGLKTESLRAPVVRIARKSRWKLTLISHFEQSGDAEKLKTLEQFGHREKHKAKWTWKNGFGLYRPGQKWTFALPPSRAADHPCRWTWRHFDEAQKLVAELDALAESRKEEEFSQTVYGGGQITHVLGHYGYDDESNWKFDTGSTERETFDSYPLAEVWREFFQHHPGTPELWLTALALTRAGVVPPREIPKKTALDIFFGNGFSLHIPEVKFPAIVGKVLELQLIEAASIQRLVEIISAVRKHTPWYFSWIWGAWYIPAVSDYVKLLASLPYTPDVFKLRAWYFRNAPFHALTQTMLPNYLEAHRQGLIDESEVFRFIFEDNQSHWWGGRRVRIFHVPEFRSDPVALKAICRIADTELEERRELAIDASEVALEIRYLPGTAYFVRILRAFGDRSFFRGYAWDGKSKAAVLSHLLRQVRPLRGENGETLKSCMGNAPLAADRLADAAMFNPAFLSIVGEYLGEPGFASAGWYFHAHISDSFDEEKRSAVARYTPITPEEFNDGAFDRDWFLSASKGVTPERFKQLYEAAKYISGSSHHRRSRIFADAALGKLTVETVEKKLDTTRDKEMLMAYGLLPGKDFRHRYERIQAFAKESKKFGSQRQASEKLAVSVALGNLSRQAGYTDINRFLWAMEDEKFQTLAGFFAPQTISGPVKAFLRADDTGSFSLAVEKDGKAQKTIPAALRTNAKIQELRAAARELREQQRRARRTLENAMTSGDEFRREELDSLRKNPLLSPMLEALLWHSGGRLFRLTDWPKEVESSVIAHPLALYESGEWSAWQKRFAEERILQPFKQVFRELYLPTEEEKREKIASPRYEGNQLQPRKAAAVLGTRGWTRDDGGLCKVFHKENLLVSVGFDVDWLSPSEVEPPTVRKVYFADRRNGKGVALDTIPGRLFSEVMRDLDLMVSVAHAGGVDPEASHSTVEMRAALVSALLPIFKLDNVRIEKSHAFIQGKFGEYTVHLGSGVCHKQASGMLNLLPVHSQTRGRLFLPFADDDPKTAEILTKILFLAEDTKIKDPNILEQIREGAK